MAHHFGSKDTNSKLERLAKYLQAFSIALKDQGFGRIYIDAFAGSGDRTQTTPSLPLFDGGESAIEEVTTPGSARLAAMLDPPMDTLVLIERDPDRYASLERLRDEFPDQLMNLHHGDANEAVRRICQNVRWRAPAGALRGFRGVIFLDPYGMEVSWDTVREIGKTQALDCWYFFPLSGLYRQAPNSAIKMTADKRAALNRIFGTEEWFDRWYSHNDAQPSLFGQPAEIVRTADVNAIENYVKERLETVFQGKVLPPRRLYHSGGAPLASLFFAVSNPNRAAVDLATKIAGQILKPGR